MRTPNEEQQKAIEHFGGVLLSAGAGSGKTFVLVEHIIFLTKDFIEKNRGLDQPTFSLSLNNYYKSIVLMTFTKKAAGELGIRLKSRFVDQLEYVKEDHQYWEESLNCLDTLFVSTIHGFCHKVLSSGVLIDLPNPLDIASSLKVSHKIDKLFSTWLDRKIEEDDSNLEIILSKKKQFLASMVKIFSDPKLRLQWSMVDSKNIDSLNELYIKDCLSILGLDQLWGFLSKLEVYNEYSDKKWYEYLLAIRNVGSNTPNTLEELQAYSETLSSFKRVMSPRKTLGLDEVNYNLGLVKDFKAFITKNIENYETFKNEFSSFVDWLEFFLEAFRYIDKNYLNEASLNFSDLEFYMLKATDIEGNIAKLSETYKYFIIDEFQDTSDIQFQIVKRIIKEDLSRVFCVGDVKQAIYGFRGGELGVFLECKEKIPLNLSLKNNYRSSSKVINFNNKLFFNMFDKSFGYEGHDSFSVEVEFQADPFPERIGTEDQGEILKSVLDIESENEKFKLSSSNLNELESKQIIDKIASIKSTHANDSICILYGRLKPSKDLMKELIALNLGFTAQVKIPYGKDLVNGLFCTLLESLLEEKDNFELYDYLIKEILVFSQINLSISEIKSIKEKFISNINLFGLFNSFSKFIYDLGIKNSNYINNLQFIEEVCTLQGDDIESTYQSINSIMGEAYSMDFQYGENSHLIQIMTAHASKGLEFDHVILGGIHTNGSMMPELNYMGTMPGSFKWTVSSAQKKPYKSPSFIYEEQLRKYKEFAESKRLFYVASTRAVKSIFWSDISANGTSSSSNKNSWINGIRSFENEFVDSAKDVYLDIKNNLESKKLSESVLSKASIKLERPVFHQDSLGIVSFKNHQSHLFVPEASVTKLAGLIDCPYQFYLKNICKLNMESDFYKSSSLELNFEDENDSSKNERLNFIEEGVKSFAQRGTQIHDAISKMILNKGFVSKEIEEKKDLDAVDWAYKLIIDNYSQHEILSEEVMKFDLFGMMITGIPDLIIKNEKSIEIWDFKTGSPNESKNARYWFQLYCYGMIFSEEYESISFKLVYVDTKEVLEQVLDSSIVKMKCFEAWSKLENLQEKNITNCKNCEFDKICQK